VSLLAALSMWGALCLQGSQVSDTELTFAGRRETLKICDLDGDGRAEIVVAATEATYATVSTPFFTYVFPPPFSGPTLRKLLVFWNTKTGFRSEAVSSYAVPRSARCFGVADVMATPGQELILFTKNEVRGLSPSPADATLQPASRFATLVRVPSFFDYADDEALPDWSLIIPSAGGNAIVAPTPSGFVVLRPSGDGKTLVNAENLSLLSNRNSESSANRFFAVTKTLPRPFIADIDGDGNPDFFLCDPSGAPQMIVYAGKPGGRFSREPVVRPSPPLRRELKNESVTFETAEALDLNRDGICDMIVSRTEGNIGLWDTLTTSQLIYYGRRGSAGFDPTPDQVVSSVGVSIVPRAIDFDGDGYPDLLVSSYRTDLLSNIKNAVLNSARVSYFLFLMDAGKYPRHPTVQRDVDLDFKVLERSGFAPRAYFDGDYDGDGVKDLLAVEEERRARVYRGTVVKAGLLQKGGYEFSSTPMMEIALRAPADLMIADLDGDGRSEIVVPDTRTLHIIKYKP
jgi:hypothetical protein